MGESPDDGRQFDIGSTIETNDGTFVVIGVQKVETTEGEHKQFNYIITSPENLIAEETQDESDN
jgi:hypothetical protein